MLIKDLKQGYGKVRAERYKQRLKKFFVFGTNFSNYRTRERGGERERSRERGRNDEHDELNIDKS